MYLVLTLTIINILKIKEGKHNFSKVYDHEQRGYKLGFIKDKIIMYIVKRTKY